MSDFYRPTRSHVAAGLIALFLGSLGLHKFYLGYFREGFIMLGVSILGGLVSFGIASAAVGLIGLIEGVIYLLTSQRDFEETYVLRKKEWF